MCRVAYHLPALELPSRLTGESLPGRNPFAILLCSLKGTTYSKKGKKGWQYTTEGILVQKGVEVRSICYRDITAIAHTLQQIVRAPACKIVTTGRASRTS